MLEYDDFLRSDCLIVSGAVHYFRTLPAQWPHRLQMLRAMGANCVETYVPWNLHESRRGEFSFDGLADIDGFLDVAADLGLAAIVRPGPYICAEWENGGLPHWLRTTDPRMPLRCTDPEFIAAVDAWFAVLIPKIAARQRDRGGNVIAVQVENEYGSYGSDTPYLHHLADALRANGITAPLFTSDGPLPSMLTAGTIPEAAATVNFGSRVTESFEILGAHRPDDRPWCMEYWNGWFDHWGEEHHTRDPADAAATLDELLDCGASVNIYMAHGGTNFGTWAGANHESGYQPTVTSYDYDAPISESGEATAKFYAFRDIISKYRPVDEEIPLPAPTLAPMTVELTQSLPLSSCLPDSAELQPNPPSFEELGLGQGLVWYQHQLRGPREEAPLTIDGLADRAQLYLDGQELAIMERDRQDEIAVSCGASGAQLDVIVESMGRVNFGAHLGESKGMTAVRHRSQQLHGWMAVPIRLDDIAALDWQQGLAPSYGPLFYRGQFLVDVVGDGFIALPQTSKGYVWVNGFCLGRHWDIGPQRTLYLPWPLLRAGDNEIVILDLHPGAVPVVEINGEPDLGD